MKEVQYSVNDSMLEPLIHILYMVNFIHQFFSRFRIFNDSILCVVASWRVMD